MATTFIHSSKANANATIPVLPEIRSLIYYWCFHEKILTFAKPLKTDANHPHELQPSHSSRSVLAVLSVSRQTRAEALPVLGREVLFDLQDNKILAAFFERFNLHFRKHIQKVSFSVVGSQIWAQPMFLNRWAGLKTLILVPGELPAAIFEVYGVGANESQKKAVYAEVKLRLCPVDNIQSADEGDKLEELKQVDLPAWIKKRWTRLTTKDRVHMEHVQSVLANHKATERTFDVFGAVVVDWNTDALIDLIHKDNRITYIPGITRKRNTVRKEEHHRRVQIAKQEEQDHRDALELQQSQSKYEPPVTRAMARVQLGMKRKLNEDEAEAGERGCWYRMDGIE